MSKEFKFPNPPNVALWGVAAFGAIIVFLIIASLLVGCDRDANGPTVADVPCVDVELPDLPPIECPPAVMCPETICPECPGTPEPEVCVNDWGQICDCDTHKTRHEHCHGKGHFQGD